jgi:hypothetical protein
MLNEVSSAADGVPPASGPVPTGMALPAAIAPLQVGGLVVTKEALIAALRLYVPQLADLTALEDGRFLLGLAPAPSPANGGQ